MSDWYLINVDVSVFAIWDMPAGLTHLPLDNMASILADILNEFSWMEMTEFRFKFQ